jgi:hypothetical protein
MCFLVLRKRCVYLLCLCIATSSVLLLCFVYSICISSSFPFTIATSFFVIIVFHYNFRMDCDYVCFIVLRLFIIFVVYVIRLPLYHLTSIVINDFFLFENAGGSLCIRSGWRALRT